MGWKRKMGRKDKEERRVDGEELQEKKRRNRKGMEGTTEEEKVRLG